MTQKKRKGLLELSDQINVDPFTLKSLAEERVRELVSDMAAFIRHKYEQAHNREPASDDELSSWHERQTWDWEDEVLDEEFRQFRENRSC